MRDKIIRSVGIVVLSTFFAAAAFAQSIEDSPGAAYVMKKVNLKGFRACHDVKDWVVTGKKTSVVFATDWDWNTYDLDLVSFGMSRTGKASAATQILPGVTSTLVELSAVWIEEDSSAPPAKKSPHGLVFAAYQSSDRKKATLAVRKFDASGAMVGGWRTLKQVSAGANETVADQWVAAELGPEGAVAAYSVFFSESSSEYYGYKSSQAFFVETDFNGKPVSGEAGPPTVKQIKIADNGNMKIVKAFRPAWNGRRWLVPLSIIRLRRVEDAYGSQDSWALLGEDVMVVVVRKTLGPKRLFGHTNADWLNTYDLRFLPRDNSDGTAPAANIGDPLKLHYRQITPLPKDERVYESFESFHGIVTVTGKGKKTGATVEVKIPEWDRTLQYDSEALLTHDTEYISRPLALGNGRYVIAQLYTMARGRNDAPPPFTWDYESELNLLQFNAATGAVTVLSTKKPTYVGYYDPPFISLFSGKIAVLNLLVTRGPQYHVDLYFSKF
jgi:hypothetical protein